MNFLDPKFGGVFLAPEGVEFSFKNKLLVLNDRSCWGEEFGTSFNGLGHCLKEL